VAITEAFNNAATISTTEYFLASNSTTKTSQTDDGVYQCFIELNNLVRGDKYVLKVYEKVRSASTDRVIFSATIANDQTDDNYVTPSLILLHGWEFSLIRTAGADRSIAWSIRKVA
jgi:hypothetical protein